MKKEKLENLNLNLYFKLHFFDIKLVINTFFKLKKLIF